MVRYIEFTNAKYFSCSSINNLKCRYIDKVICKGLLEREETAEPDEIVLVRLVYLSMIFSNLVIYFTFIWNRNEQTMYY